MITEFTDEDSGATWQAEPGDTARIVLSENPTTGYRWELTDSLPTIVELVSDTFTRPDDEGRVGSGGIHTWVLGARSRGNGILRLGYRRPWEEGKPLRGYSLTVSVQ